MKKFTAFALVLLLLFSMSACSDDTLLSPEDPVTLTMWHVYGEQSDSPMNRLVEEFNNTVGLEKGIVIHVSNVTSTSKISAQLLESMDNVPGAPDMPDLFSAHTSTAASIGAENLVNWNEHFTEDELSNYVPEFLAEGTMDSSLAVFPVSKSTYALFLNGSQFERFSADTGVTYESLGTWDGFFSAAEQFYNWSGGKTFCALDYLIRHVELDILAKGDDLTYTADGWYDFESQALKDSWTMFAGALVQGHIAVSDLYANTQVMTGEALGGIGSTAAIGYYNDVVTYPDNTSEPTNLMVLPLPRTENAPQQYMPQTGVGMCAYKTTDQKAEAASVFLHWFTEGQRNLDFVVSTGYMPVHNDAYAAIESYDFPNEGYANLYNAIHTMRQEYTPVVRPTFGGYYDKVDALYAGLREMKSSLHQRLTDGESVEILVNDTWEFFCGIQ